MFLTGCLCLQFHYWLNTIHAQAPHAPITLVATKADLVSEADCKARLAIIEDSLVGAPYRSQIVGGVIPVSSKVPKDEGIEAVRRDIKDNLIGMGEAAIAAEKAAGKRKTKSCGGAFACCGGKPAGSPTREVISVVCDDGSTWQKSLRIRPTPGLEGYGEIVPLGWFRFHEMSVDLKKSGTKRLSLDQARERATKFGIGVKDEGVKDKELLLMLSTFTSTGILKHADQPRIRDVIIIDLQWLVDTLCELLSQRSICRNVFRTQLAQVLRQSCSDGMLNSGKRLHSTGPLVRRMFSLFDLDGDGEVTKEEFQKHHTMAGFHNATRNVAAVAAAASVSIDHAADRALLATLPLSVDWTLIGAVTPVKNQGQCGSCWVFAATGSMEGALSIASGKAAVSLSEEEYLACYGKDYTVCNGGDAAQALRWAQNHSICTEASYPYVAPTGKPFPPPPTLVCHASNCSNPANVGVPQGYVTQIHYVTPKSEVALMEAVSIGPVAVSIDAGALSQYRSGVISGQCAGYIGDHAVLVVGYGHDDASGLDYWKVKNSYGIDFGEAGYFRAQRNNTKCGGGTGEMGILESPVYPTIVVK
jgi:C1A family cysteine protease